MSTTVGITGTLQRARSGPFECNVVGALLWFTQARRIRCRRRGVWSSGRIGLEIAPGGGDTATNILI